LELRLTNIPPPPPGFEDSGDEFYLDKPEFPVEEPTTEDTETMNLSEEEVERQGEVLMRRTGSVSDRRQRPKMTLSFGVDPSRKSLMFTTNSPFGLNDCVEVDPNLPLDRQDWYHGAISRREAEEILRNEGEGSYLVRSVDSSRQEYALSLKSARGFMHMKIRRDPESREFRLSDFERRFMTVSQMAHHYTRNRLPIKGAEHMCLKTPVKGQLL